ncbi:nephrin isoform X2 [Nilaparvata lugens]|uniref:nephrin isoform X2 n=1 Tax=Nilaparvata lugens TaxID=108931 RepID=UPI00193E1211|nr:nephrin isoform X2 [Nilaparvata lugens]
MGPSSVIGLVFLTVFSLTDGETHRHRHERFRFAEKVAVHHVQAIAGRTAELPCQLSTKQHNDKAQLVLWYKTDDNVKARTPSTPIYSYDARGGGLESLHWSDTNVLGSRAFLRTDVAPAKLVINAVKETDGGLYKCRVDFQRSPTTNTRVNLSIIVPPERLSVVDEHGVHIQNYILGPYNEGDSIDIACIATGGRPTTRVTWWQDTALLDDTWETMTNRRVRNVLSIAPLQRHHLHAVFTCQAANNNLVPPISSSVTVDLNLSPLWVRLVGENKPLSAGAFYEFKCEVVGARPSPQITWWKDSLQLLNSTQTTSPDGNRTESTLIFSPMVSDHESTLTCKTASTYDGNELPPYDSWTLNVRHIPIVSIVMLRSSNASTVNEGSPVSMKCVLEANPPVYKVVWKHNDKVISVNGSDGYFFDSATLLINNCSRAHSGVYSCVASNQEGDGYSQSISLDVKFAPICRPGQKTTVLAARYEPTEIICEVEANPAEVSFTWRMESATETDSLGGFHDGAVTYSRTDGTSSNEVVPDSRDGSRDERVEFSVEDTRSTATFRPASLADYGTVSCWATNSLGRQTVPCQFYLVPAVQGNQTR